MLKYIIIYKFYIKKEEIYSLITIDIEVKYDNNLWYIREGILF